MLYEYRCMSCQDQVVANARLEEYEDFPELSHDSAGRVTDPATPYYDICAGPLKRVWSVGFQIKSTDWGH